MSFDKSQGGSLSGLYIINFCVAPLALIYALAGANTQSYTKKIVTNSTIQIGYVHMAIIRPSDRLLTKTSFSIANIIGPQTFQARQAPGYIGAKITILVVNGAAMVTTAVLRIVYGWRNRRRAHAREAQLGAIASGEATVQELVAEEDMTDLRNPAFVYVY
jgi:hypothetical protein